jgi:hypothetical protein
VPSLRHREDCACAQTATQTLKVGAPLLVKADELAVEERGARDHINQAAQLRELGRAIPARARTQRHASVVHAPGPACRPT